MQAHLYSSWPAVSRISNKQVSPSITTCFLYESSVDKEISLISDWKTDNWVSNHSNVLLTFRNQQKLNKRFTHRWWGHTRPQNCNDKEELHTSQKPDFNTLLTDFEWAELLAHFCPHHQLNGGRKKQHH